MNSAFSRAIDDLVKQGWHSCLDFFDQELLKDLRKTLLHLQEEDAFRPAKVGKGKQETRHSEIRGDWIRWLSDSGDFTSTKTYLDIMDQFKQALNRELFLGVHEYEAHFAIYPAGAFYKKHLDRHRQTPHRLLTTTLYLNHDYSLEQGGAIEIEDLKGNHITTLMPEWGRFVCFLSADFPHQVLPTTVKRYSLTGWMRTQE